MAQYATDTRARTTVRREVPPAQQITPRQHHKDAVAEDCYTAVARRRRLQSMSAPRGDNDQQRRAAVILGSRTRRGSYLACLPALQAKAKKLSQRQ